VNKVCRAAEPGECSLPETCNGISAECPEDLHKPTGTACQGDTGACYAGECQTHFAQCQMHGYSFACESNDQNDGDDGCGHLFCKRTSSSACEKVSGNDNGGRAVEDGTPCTGNRNTDAQDRKVCSDNSCVASTELALPFSVTCHNGVLDPGETDVDCGGSTCFPCLPGEKCLRHDDCFGTESQPGLCSSAPTSAPTISFVPPPEPTKCDDLDQDSCMNFTGCIYLDDFSRCRPTDILPPSGSCDTQKKEPSCINWQGCQWDNDQLECVSIPAPPTPSPSPGVCVAPPSAKGPGDTDGFLDKDWKENWEIIVGAGAGTLILGLLCAFIVCRKHCSCCRKKKPQRPKYDPTSFQTQHQHSTATTSMRNPTQGNVNSEYALPQAAPAAVQSMPPPRCPSCRVNYGNPANDGGLCNACNQQCFSLQIDSSGRIIENTGASAWNSGDNQQNWFN